MKTTREAAREDSHKERAKYLQELLEKNYDAEKGFKKAMEHAKKPDIKRFLKEQAVMHNHFATELDSALRRLNVEPKEKGSVTGSLHRTWMDIKTTFTKDDDEAVLEECLRAEKAALKEYENKLEKTTFSPVTTEMLKDHYNRIRSSVNEIKRLEDLVD